MSRARATNLAPAASLAPAALLAALFTASPAQAEQPFTSAGGGLFIGWAGHGVHWGFEAFATHEFNYEVCSSAPRTVIGPIARFTLDGLSEPTFSLGGHLGSEARRAFLGFSGELGVALGFPNGLESDAKVSPYTGLAVESLIFNVFARQAWLLQRYPVGLGVRFLPTMGLPGFCMDGRPQRDARSRPVPSGAPRREVNTRLPRRAQRARAFAKAAAEEYASVPAFLQLALELHAAGASAHLVRRALIAATDELRHTAVCSSLVTHFSGAPFLPPKPPHAQRPPLTGTAARQRLAVESWLDGCLGEGQAAERLIATAESDPDPVVRQALFEIAADETQHAELGWDILGWCLETTPEIGLDLRAQLTTQGQPASALAARSNARLAQLIQ